MARVANLPTNIRYYCHQCEIGISPNLEDFTCPTCHGGFIEELRGNEIHPQSISTTRGHPGVRGNNEMEDFFETLLMRSVGVEPTEMDSEMASSDESEYQGVMTRSRQNRARSGAGSRTNTTTMVTGPHRIIQHTIPMSLFSQFPSVGGNQDMFDLLITHLMNAAPSGPPPASVEEISRLPRIKLSAEQVAKHEKCSVCFDDYSDNDNCIKLVCDHVFHEACISTWLKRHGTCPVCRKDLNGHMTQYDSTSPGNAPGGPSRTIFISNTGGGSSQSLF